MDNYGRENLPFWTSGEALKHEKQGTTEGVPRLV